MHLVLIVAVLDFSALVLYEAVLSYVGVGVDPNSSSFGSMINLARSEMSRDPAVWWNLATAFTFMLALVLAANLFADAVREAFDPRARAFKPRRLLKEARERMPPTKDARPAGLSAREGNGKRSACRRACTVLDTDAGLVRAVDALSLSIERGETFALVGESGCGKSMTALSILRLLPDNGRVDSGRIDLAGTDVTALPEARMRDVRGRRISIIFQEPATSLNPVLRVGDQIIEVIERHTALKGAAARARALRVAAARRPAGTRAAHRHLSVRALGRPEAARDDRDRAGGRARRADRRRANHGARRHDPEADPRAADGVAEDAGHGDAADHA